MAKMSGKLLIFRDYHRARERQMKIMSLPPINGPWLCQGFDEFQSINKLIFTILKKSPVSDVSQKLISSCGEGPCCVLFHLEVCRCCVWILPWNVVLPPPPFPLWVCYGNRTSLLLILVHSTLPLKMPRRLKVHANVCTPCFVNQSCTGWRREATS